jgi:anti-sigma B factor antagonist
MGIIEKDQVHLLLWDHDITLKNVDDFRLAVLELLKCNGNKLILELTGVEYVNSTALGVIADSFQTSRQSHKELVVAGVQPPVEEIFKIVRFGTFIKIFIMVEEAFDYFHSDSE